LQTNVNAAPEPRLDRIGKLLAAHTGASAAAEIELKDEAGTNQPKGTNALVRPIPPRRLAPGSIVRSKPPPPGFADASTRRSLDFPSPPVIA